MKKLISKLTSAIAHADMVLDTEIRAITNTPWIVASEDLIYTVAAENGCAKVEIGTLFATMFTERTAKEVVENFKASNGNGPINWVMISEKEFYTRKRIEWKQLLESIQ